MLAAGAVESAAQDLDGIVVPGGGFAVELFPSFHSFHRGYDPGGEERPLGAPFRSDALGTALLPQLEPPEEALRALLDAPELQLQLGASRAVIEGHEAEFPIRAAWGVTDWLTLGATVPIVRRRVESGFSFSPAGANAGAAPPGGELDGFLSSMAEALGEASTVVEGICQEEGGSAPACQEGRNLLETGDSLLEGLTDALRDAPVAPLAGSTMGTALLDRVESLRSGLADLGAASFGADLPLPEEPLDEDAFRTRFLDPIYGADGPPATPWPGIPELGDVELRAASRLLDLTFGGTGGDEAPLRFQTAVEVSMRFGTQQPDTLRDHFENLRPRGHSGVRVRLANELQLLSWFGLGVRLEAEDFGPAEVRRRVASPTSPLNPAPPRVLVRWTPGRVVRLEAMPRLRFTPELSVGGHYAFTARADGRYELVEPADVDPDVLLPPGRVRTHRLGIQVRYSTLRGHAEGVTPVPFTVRLGMHRTLAGAGGRVPAGTRVEGGARLFLGL